MPRVNISLPESFVFSTEITIYIGHINYADHLDNSALLALVSEARVRYFKSLGYTELNIEGVGIVLADAAIQYKSEAHHGEVLIFEMAPHDFSKYGFDLAYRVSEKTSRREVARGKTGILFFDYAIKKPARIPVLFKQKIGEE